LVPGIGPDLLEAFSDELVVTLDDPDAVVVTVCEHPGDAETGVLLPADGEDLGEFRVRDGTGLRAGADERPHNGHPLGFSRDCTADIVLHLDSTHTDAVFVRPCSVFSQ